MEPRPSAMPSMEPPRVSDGNRINGSAYPGAFNGATALRRWKPAWNSMFQCLQWSHRPSAMETGRQRQRPAPSLQWSHRPSAMETRPEDQRRRGDIPSMEPPPFGDGNPARRSPSPRRSRFLQWSHRPSAMETCSSILQWSHRPSAMETRQRPVPVCYAFNGATALRRWKPPTATKPAPIVAIQWSHRPSAMETSSPASEGCHLQWSHRPSAMETGGALRTSRTASRPFNGATALRRWKPGVCHEPPPFGDGNRPKLT